MPEFPYTGDFLTDLRDQLHSFVRTLMERPGAASKLIAEIGATHGDDTLAAAFHQDYTTPRRALTQTISPWPAGAVKSRRTWTWPALADQLWRACYHKVVLFGEA